MLEEVSVCIVLDSDIRRLLNKLVSIVKVLWCNHGDEEATWEQEEDMRSVYSKFFWEMPIF